MPIDERNPPVASAFRRKAAAGAELPPEGGSRECAGRDRGRRDGMRSEGAMKSWGVLGALVLALVAGGDVVRAAAMPAESARMARAKDLMSDDQWSAAIP